MKCDRVTPNLFVGPDPREAADFEQLRLLNVSAILSLQTEDDRRGRVAAWEKRPALEGGPPASQFRSGRQISEESSGEVSRYGNIGYNYDRKVGHASEMRKM